MKNSRYDVLREAIAGSQETTSFSIELHSSAARCFNCKPFPVATKVVVAKKHDSSGEVMEHYVGTLQAFGKGLVLFDYTGKDLLFVDKTAPAAYRFRSLKKDLYRWNGTLSVAEEIGNGTLYLDHDRDTYCYHNLFAEDFRKICRWLDQHLDETR